MKARVRELEATVSGLQIGHQSTSGGEQASAGRLDARGVGRWVASRVLARELGAKEEELKEAKRELAMKKLKMVEEWRQVKEERRQMIEERKKIMEVCKEMEEERKIYDESIKAHQVTNTFAAPSTTSLLVILIATTPHTSHTHTHTHTHTHIHIHNTQHTSGHHRSEGQG